MFTIKGTEDLRSCQGHSNLELGARTRAAPRLGAMADICSGGQKGQLV